MFQKIKKAFVFISQGLAIILFPRPLYLKQKIDKAKKNYQKRVKRNISSFEYEYLIFMLNRNNFKLIVSSQNNESLYSTIYRKRKIYLLFNHREGIVVDFLIPNMTARIFNESNIQTYYFDIKIMKNSKTHLAVSDYLLNNLNSYSQLSFDKNTNVSIYQFNKKEKFVFSHNKNLITKLIVEKENKIKQEKKYHIDLKRNFFDCFKNLAGCFQTLFHLFVPRTVIYKFRNGHHARQRFNERYDYPLSQFEYELINISIFFRRYKRLAENSNTALIKGTFKGITFYAIFTKQENSIVTFLAEYMTPNFLNHKTTKIYHFDPVIMTGSRYHLNLSQKILSELSQYELIQFDSFENTSVYKNKDNQKITFSHANNFVLDIA